MSKKDESVIEIEIAFEVLYILTILLRFRTQLPVQKVPVLITNYNTSIFLLTLHKLHYIKIKAVLFETNVKRLITTILKHQERC